MRFADEHMDRLVDIVREANETEVLPRFHGLSAGDISTKNGAIDVVTEADTRAEVFITDALKKLYPNALVFGEEAYSADPRVADGLGDAELAFVIDPVDGTMNFTTGLSMFGTIVAVTANGETIAGLHYEPLQDNRLTVIRGAGAYESTKHGRSAKLKVADPVPVSEMKGVINWAYFPEPYRSRVPALMPKLRFGTSTNCSVFDYWLTSTGRYHFMGNASGNLWDHLAGVLMQEEAGGYAARFDGSAYTPKVKGAEVICAPDRDSWEAVRREIFGIS